tara:strand:- start:232 stop:558 length:327 start_codon:yes stop_codon:yes gene_type:complete
LIQNIFFIHFKIFGAKMPSENQPVHVRSSGEAANFWAKIRPNCAVTDSLRPKSISDDVVISHNRPVPQEQHPSTTTLFQRQMKPWDPMPKYNANNDVLDENVIDYVKS